MPPFGHTRPGKTRRRGFTLIEVMTAITVMVFVFMSSLSAITIGYRIIENARFSTLASQVLQSEMENLRLKNWSQLCELPASGPFSVDSSMTTAAFGRLHCTRQITDVAADLKQVTVMLSWNSMDGRAHSRRYTTLIAKDGLNDYYYRRF